MDDLISRQALKDAMYHEAFEVDSELQKWDSGCWIRYKMFENVIDDVPSVDAVEVVRCRDCKHWVRDGNESFGYAMFCKANCSLGGQGIKKPDDFCSYGERKTDG